MLGFLKAFVQRFMASKSDYPHCIHPACEIRENALSWCDGPLGRHFLHTNNGRLYQVEHCKAQGSPFHEFIRVFFIFRVDGATFRIAAIFDRCPADAIDRIPESPNASTSSLLSLPSINSPRSPSPASSERMQAALGKGGCFFAAHDRIFMPKEGCIDELDPLTATLFGAYDILNTISIDKTHTAMTVPDFASLIEVVHAMAPKYTVNKHQCYWFALIVFLVIRERTGAKEKAGDCIRNVGKWYFIQPNHKASEDKGVAVEEFRTATDRLKTQQEHLLDPDKASGLMRARMDDAERRVEEAKYEAKAARREAEAAKREAEEERQTSKRERDRLHAKLRSLGVSMDEL